MRLIDADELVKVRPFCVAGGPIRDYTEGFVDCAEEAREAIKKHPHHLRRACGQVPGVQAVGCRPRQLW